MTEPLVRSKVISLNERLILARLKEHLKELGLSWDATGKLAPDDQTKSTLRSVHTAQRDYLLQQESAFISRAWPELGHHFACGVEVDPSSISPRLELIHAGTWQSNLFRLASLTWSIPVSRGYGRRLRFLVWDDHNDKLIGLLALGDPVFNLKVRDSWVGWNAEARKERLVGVMDAYVLGALPPYSRILGGKLVAALLRTQEIRKHFERKYRRSRGIISQSEKRASLLLITTTSAFGRSSVYNRVRLDSISRLEPLGFTSGYGHFHVPADLFQLIRAYLRSQDHKYAANFRYGDGPNWRLRAAREALSQLGVSNGVLRHGVKREVYACAVAVNAQEILRGDAVRPSYKDLLWACEVGALARERWMVPRAARDSSFRNWNRSEILGLLDPSVATHELEIGLNVVA